MDVNLLFFNLLMSALIGACLEEKLQIFILDQTNSFHAEKGIKLKHVLDRQAASLTKANPLVTIEVLHHTFPDSSYWSIIPVLTRSKNIPADFDWFVFIEEKSHVNLEKLMDVLHTYGFRENFFLGNALSDAQPTILHHFNSDGYLFPARASGFAINSKLIQMFSEEELQKHSEFQISIDPQYELAVFISSKGINLTHAPEFCLQSGPSCAIVAVQDVGSSCGDPVHIDKIHFAIKTWSGNHNSRLPVLFQTWLSRVDYTLYSDVEDEKISTVATGIPNTKSGHCAKTLKILEKELQLVEKKAKDWVVLADDDTLMNVKMLQNVLGCYARDEPLLLGERYGYSVGQSYGYDYITGGGGIVFNRKALELLINNCRCSQIDQPDDMILGMCAKRIQLPLTHSSLFHQARPMDYPEDLLKLDSAVSFHTFWGIDPLQVYQDWLIDDAGSSATDIRTEL